MKVAAIQAAPVFLDAAATLDKTLALMREVAEAGAELCVFPETFLSGYPAWSDITDSGKFNEAGQKAAYAAYIEGSVYGDGPEMAAIAEEARQLGIFTYLGLIERDRSGGSVYCSLAAFDPEKGLVSMHRKMRPTHAERMVWSNGDGAGLKVHAYKNFRVGGLNCWENWMPLARYAMYAQGEHLHVSTWPGFPWLTRDIARFTALEGRVYVVAVGGVLTAKDIPDGFPLKSEMVKVGDRYLTGGTRIVGPDGEQIAEAGEGEETILYADLDVNRVLEERQNFDPAGHYSRRDVLKLEVDRTRQNAIEVVD